MAASALAGKDRISTKCPTRTQSRMADAEIAGTGLLNRDFAVDDLAHFPNVANRITRSHFLKFLKSVELIL